MTDFNITYSKIIQPNEGYYSNAKNDLGGLTYGGISYVYNPSWEGWSLIKAYISNKGGVSKMKRNERIPEADNLVTKFYQNLWRSTHMDLIKNQDVANFLFDWIVNSGENIAIEHLQGLLNLKQDGDIGNITVNAINNSDSTKLYNDLKNLRTDYVIAVAKKHPEQETFLSEWEKRINSFPTITKVAGGFSLLVLGGLLATYFVLLKS